MKNLRFKWLLFRAKVVWSRPFVRQTKKSCGCVVKDKTKAGMAIIVCCKKGCPNAGVNW